MLCRPDNKSICDIKWNRLETKATQPWRAKSQKKITQWGKRLLRQMVHTGHQFSAETMATNLLTSCLLQISSRTVQKDFHGWAAASVVRRSIFKCKVCYCVDFCVGPFFRNSSFIPVKRTLNASSYKHILDHFTVSTWVSMFIKTCVSRFGV